MNKFATKLRFIIFFYFQACLRHPDCPSARENRDTVFCQMRRAMDLIHYVVKDGVLDCQASLSPRSQVLIILNLDMS